MNTHRDLDAAIRSDFATFCEVFFEIATGEKFEQNWHFDVMALKLEGVFVGATRRLVVNLPPRSGKSYCISMAYPAWVLGKKPKTKFICVSYSQELSTTLAEGTRKIMQSPLYRRIFPNTCLTKQRPRTDDLKTTAGGGRFATSIGGTLTGLGGDIIIVDDPMRTGDVDSVIPCKPKGNKKDRLLKQADLIDGGRVFLSDASFVDQFLEEITFFPGGAHDDYVDALSQFLRWVRGREFEKGRRLRASSRRRKSDPNSAAARIGRLQGSLGARGVSWRRGTIGLFGR